MVPVRAPEAVGEKVTFKMQLCPGLKPSEASMLQVPPGAIAKSPVIALTPPLMPSGVAPCAAALRADAVRRCLPVTTPSSFGLKKTTGALPVLVRVRGIAALVDPTARLPKTRSPWGPFSAIT